MRITLLAPRLPADRQTTSTKFQVIKELLEFGVWNLGFLLYLIINNLRKCYIRLVFDIISIHSFFA